MKNIFNKTFINSSKINFLMIIFILIIGFTTSCKDEPTTLSTFTKEMMGDYLTNRPEEFSEFKRLLDTTQVLSLVNTYGKYTLFAPNNKAMKEFYAAKGRNSLKDFTVDTLRKVAYDHIIKGYVVKSEEFVDGLMPFLTMSERFIASTSHTTSGGFVYYVNNTSAILTKDIEVSNGVIHVINKVIDPSILNIAQAIVANKRFSIFSEALMETGLIDSLYLTEDRSYNPKNYSYIDVTWVQGSGSVDELPVSKKFGYTLLAESNDTYNAFQIKSLADLKVYAAANVYHEDPIDATISDPKDRRNSLNKFISYHLINKKLTYSKFINDYDTPHMIKTFDMFEYIETMCANTLIEIKKERSSGETNLINKSVDTGNAVHIIAKDSDAVNGVYHEIDKILIYSKDVAGEMASKRLRMDAASFFPEITNNNMRYYDASKPRSWVFPPGYIKRLTASATTRFCYLNAFGGYLDYQGDEIYLKGMYDFTLETPPIPIGTYEVRLSYQPTAGRGAAQLYWDGVPCGIPLDLRLLASNPLIGYEEPNSNNIEDPFGYENDKMMRNRGYMKGPNTYMDVLGWWYSKKVARQSNQSLRRILGTFTFSKASTHKFTVKAVREGQFMMDFLEFVPVELIENEGID